MVIYVIPGSALDNAQGEESAYRYPSSSTMFFQFSIYFYWIFGLRKYEIGYLSSGGPLSLLLVQLLHRPLGQNN